MPGPLPPELVTGYLLRLGLDREPPSIDGLVRLHRAHVESVPYETLWIQQGLDWGISPRDSASRIATTGRGGYCFHLNGAFGLLLQSLGYRVKRYAGAVHRDTRPNPGDFGNHMVLTVNDLAGASNPGGVWYVDVGLGDALHEPLPLRPDDYRQGPLTFCLERSPTVRNGWQLTNDPSGGFRFMTWESVPLKMSRFGAQHRSLSTSPDSGFVRVLTLQRRDATGADTLRGCTLRRTGENAFTRVLETRSDLESALLDTFSVNSSTLATLDQVWERARAAHEMWLAAGNQ